MNKFQKLSNFYENQKNYPNHTTFTHACKVKSHQVIKPQNKKNINKKLQDTFHKNCKVWFKGSLFKCINLKNSLIYMIFIYFVCKQTIERDTQKAYSS